MLLKKRILLVQTLSYHGHTIDAFLKDNDLCAVKTSTLLSNMVITYKFFISGMAIDDFINKIWISDVYCTRATVSLRLLRNQINAKEKKFWIYSWK